MMGLLEYLKNMNNLKSSQHHLQALTDTSLVNFDVNTQIIAKTERLELKKRCLKMDKY